MKHLSRLDHCREERKLKTVQLKEILSSLEVTPFYFNAIIAAAFILMILSFVALLASDKDDGLKQPIAVVSMLVFLIT